MCETIILDSHVLNTEYGPPTVQRISISKNHLSAHLEEDGTLAIVPKDPSAKDGKDPWASHEVLFPFYFYNFYLHSCSQDFNKNSCHPGFGTALQNQAQSVHK